MKKILLISGSARNGNCKTVLENIQKNFWLEFSTDLIFLRDYNIKSCIGCNSCASNNSPCVLDDRYSEIVDKLNDADIVVIATPNYFYNISGLTKTFLDRTFSCYNHQSLKGKKFIYVYVGEDQTTTTKKYLDNAMYGFTICHEVTVLGSFAYSAGGIGEFKDMIEAKNTTDEIVKIIRENLAD